MACDARKTNGISERNLPMDGRRPFAAKKGVVDGWGHPHNRCGVITVYAADVKPSPPTRARKTA